MDLTSNRVFTRLGVLFIAVGFLFNEWVLSALLSPDGTIELSTRTTIWLFNLLMILVGFLLIKIGRDISSPSSLLGNLALLILVIPICVVGAEFALRMTGNTQWRPQQVSIEVEPGGRFFRKDSTLGYTHLPGEYQVILPRAYSIMVVGPSYEISDTLSLPSSYSFNVTHLSNSLRATSHLNPDEPDLSKNEIWIFGCSLTHGWSLNDEETYPWILQQGLPQYEIVNFGVTGYGTLHSLIQLREALIKRKKPEVAIVAYASFQDRRNTFLRLRRKGLVTLNKLGPLVQPYARVTDDGALTWSMAKAQFHEFPLMRYSALIHAVERAYNRIEDRFYQSHEVSKAIVKELSDLCQKNGVQFFLAGITSDALTMDMLEYGTTQGILTIDISVDMSLPDNHNYPYDNHPSFFANQQYAQKLDSFLRNEMLGR